MARVFLLVLAAIAAATAAPEVEDNATTLWEYLFERYHVDMHFSLFRHWISLMNYQAGIIESQVEDFSGNLTLLPLTEEILQYVEDMQIKIVSEFASGVSKMTVESIYQDVNDHCGEYLKTPIVDLLDVPSNVTCVAIQLRKTLSWKLKVAIDVGLQRFEQQPSLCKKVHANCTTAYEQRTNKLLSSYIEDATEEHRVLGSTPLEITDKFLYQALNWVGTAHYAAYSLLKGLAYFSSTAPSIEPFAIENLIQSRTNEEVQVLYFRNYTTLQSEEQLTWGIVRSDAGSVGLPCSSNKDSKQYLKELEICYFSYLLKSNIDLLRCAYSNQTWSPLALSTVPSAYFHSQCLCLAYHGAKCGVTTPQGVDPHIFCLSVLLRDFQRQVSYRPAVTYLDYSFKTRVPVCQFSNLLKVGFIRTCNDPSGDFNSILSVQCYFKDLVNKQLNCSETPLVNSYNITELCNFRKFMHYVLCDGDGDVEFSVPYYRAGDSPLVLFLTYGDVVVRVLTMVTYLACKQLRNLPGKLLIAYLVTALLRLVVVRATLADMALAVRLDVATDLSSTLWLTAYLHFLTVSIRDLRPPDSLSPDEARMVLLRYSLVGWVLPAALSSAFFWMDEVTDSRVNIGQLLFLICNYVALLGNIYMCYINCSFYYDVKNSAREIKKGGKKRDVFAAIFNFAIKTAVLSGAGITFRLVFTQIQGLEQLLGYYHALGTLQGLLVFLLYGCNHEARAFWLQVARSTFSRFLRPRRNVPV